MSAPRTESESRRKGTAPAAEPGREAWVLLSRLLRADGDALLAAWAEFGLTSAQGNLLQYLEPGKLTTMVSLARVLRCHDSNVTGLVDKLEERGLVVRQGDPKDRRVKLIALTEGGVAFRERVLERVADPPPFIASLAPSDKKVLRDLLRRAWERKALEPSETGGSEEASAKPASSRRRP